MSTVFRSAAGICTCAAFATLSLTSCTDLVHREAVGMRQHALDYYNAQIMDNLISGSRGLLILHVDIDSLTTAVKASNTTALGAGRTKLDSSEQTGSPLGVSKIADSVTKPFTATGTSLLEGNLQSLAKPSKDPYLYRSYLQFLNLQHEGQRLHEVKNFDYLVGRGCHSIRYANSRRDIQEGSYVEGTITRSNGKFYYVPIEFNQGYFDLLLAVTGKIDPTGNRGGTAASGNKSTGSESKPAARSRSKYEIPAEMKSVDEILDDKVRDNLLRSGFDNF